MHKTIKNRHSHHNVDLYDDLSKIKEAISQATSDVKSKASEILSESVSNVKERSLNIQDNITDYLVEKPYRSLGIAMLAGLLLGYFLKK